MIGRAGTSRWKNTHGCDRGGGRETIHGDGRTIGRMGTGPQSGEDDRTSAIARMRSEAVSVFGRAVEAVFPRERVAREVVSLLRGREGGRGLGNLVVLGAGKAAPAMALGLEDAVVEFLGPRPEHVVRGLVVAPRGGREETRWVEVIEASHPVPGPDSETAGRRLLALAAEVTSADVVVALLSGGASALLSTPADGVRREDLEEVTRLLLASGAPIDEVNVVRTHLSSVAGGLLGLALRGVPAVCLVVSDVVGDDLAVVGSAPFFGDDSTYADSLDILRARDLLARMPVAARRRLELGAAGRAAETPSAADPRLRTIEHRVVARGLDACRAATAACERLGYRSLLLSHALEGEARTVGVVHAGVARGAHLDGVPLSPPCAVVSGGESTVVVRGPGLGGRNQEACLAAAPHLAGLPAVFLSAGTDGVDGPTEAAGGVVDGGSWARARAAGVDIASALDRNDSHRALQAMGDVVLTGPTGTNVGDLRVLLVAD